MYTCKSCEYSSSTKLGKCPSCGEFWTFFENKSLSKPDKKASKHAVAQWDILESKINSNHNPKYFDIQSKELQRVFGNGIKWGGMYLLGGAPGIGKSTLILQILQEVLGHNDLNIWYFSGEEQESQVWWRWARICGEIADEGQSLAESITLYHSTKLEDIISTTKEKGFDFIVIDSIQTIYSTASDSSAGSANQVKYCAEKLSEYCKSRGVTMFIIGHITKWGEIAGPKYLEHIVDVVLYLEGDRFGQLRFLRSQKNRFGHTDDSAIFEMTLFGLKPVYDLKERILSSANTSIPGSVLTIGLDNGRPVLTNVEVLLNKTKFKFPTRNCIWVSSKRVDLVIAILERYLKIDLSYFDVFVNVPGEFSFHDSGLDLAIGAGILAQYKNQSPSKNIIFLAELGLWGQLVKSKLHDKRLREIPEGFDLIDPTDYKNVIQLKNIF